MDEEDPIDVVIDIEPAEPPDILITEPVPQDPSSSSHSPPPPKTSTVKKAYTKTSHSSRTTTHSPLVRKGPVTRSQIARMTQPESDIPSQSPLGEGMEDT